MKNYENRKSEGQSKIEALSKWLPGVLTKVRMPTVKTKTMWAKTVWFTGAIRMRGKVCRKPYERQLCPGRLNAKKGRRTELFTDHGDLTVELTADTLRLQMNHVCTKKEFWYRKRVPQSAHGEFSWRKCVCRRRQGYLPKIVTKIYEMPTTFESSVVK